MIVDSSAVVAVITREPASGPILERLVEAEVAGIGTPTLAETGVVLAARLGVQGKTLLARFVSEVGLIEVAFGDEHWPVAVDAYLRFGRGRHPARLNFGDCLTYAVAKLSGLPLLCVGGDFEQTDLTLAPLTA